MAQTTASKLTSCVVPRELGIIHERFWPPERPQPAKGRFLNGFQKLKLALESIILVSSLYLFESIYL